MTRLLRSCENPPRNPDYHAMWLEACQLLHQTTQKLDIEDTHRPPRCAESDWAFDYLDEHFPGLWDR